MMTFRRNWTRTGQTSGNKFHAVVRRKRELHWSHDIRKAQELTARELEHMATIFATFAVEIRMEVYEAYNGGGQDS